MTLETDEIHVWIISLETENINELRQILSASELARADRFRLAKDKTQFIAARAFLRMILGKYLNITPEQLDFEYNKFGKPFIKDATKRSFKFNMSHSHKKALCAVTLINEIGVDIELIDPTVVDEELAAQTLTQYEFEYFKNLPESRRIEQFYKFWTGKEAYAKAQGDGLMTSPDKIELLFPKFFPNHNREKGLATVKTPDWSYFELPPPAAGFAAGLVVMGEADKNFRLFEGLT